MNAGAFSEDKVVAAAQRVVPILVDCSKPGQNEELMKKYNVSGFPTVLYTDPEGKQLKEMESRDASAILKDIEGVAAKNPGRPSMWQSSLKNASALAKKAKKPVVVYLADPKADLVKVNAKLMKDLGDRKVKFLWVLELGREETLKKHGAETAPSVVMIDPKTDEPVARIAVKEDDKADVLNKALDEAAKSIKK